MHSTESEVVQETPAEAKPARKTIKCPYPHLFRILHWTLGLSILVLFASGLSQHAAARPAWSIFSGTVPAWLWSGSVGMYHLAAAVFFVPSVIVVTLIYIRGRVLYRAVHVVLLVGGLSIVVTGIIMFMPFGGPGTYGVSRFLHATMGVVVLPIAFGWHAIYGLVKRPRLLIQAYRPFTQARWVPWAIFAPLAIVTTAFILNAVPFDSSWRELTVVRIEAGSTELTELPWDDAQPFSLSLNNGTNFVKGHTDVTLRALHDGNELFVLAEWSDPTKDTGYWPWKKTEDGWFHQVNSAKDETLFYEDKFALVFPIQDDWQFERFGCAASCHVGSGYPFGYKSSASPIDVWHWKSARTGSSGQVDDKYWADPDFERKDIGRYGDPKEEGSGYVVNDNEDKTLPAFLPNGPDAYYEGALLKAGAVEYTEEAAAEIAPGTIVPGVVTGTFLGDRGNVSCESHYDDAEGRWRLYIRRDLDTDSEFDVQFAPGGSYPFGCAAFDHVGKRHAYAMSTYRMKLEE